MNSQNAEFSQKLSQISSLSIIALFIEELPNQLRIELAMVIHQKMYSNVQFFKGKDKSLIAWIGSVIKPLTFDAK